MTDRSAVRIVFKHCPRCGKFDLFLGRQKYCDACKLEIKLRRQGRWTATQKATQAKGATTGDA